MHHASSQSYLARSERNLIRILKLAVHFRTCDFYERLKVYDSRYRINHGSSLFCGGVPVFRFPGKRMPVTRLPPTLL